MAKVKPNKIFSIIFGCLLSIGFIGFVLLIIHKVVTGHGLDYYKTGHGVEMNYIGALITVCIMFIVSIIGLVVNIILKLRENYLISKYNKKKKKQK